MPRNALDEVLDAMPPRPRIIACERQTGASVPSVRLIPRPCSCTWRLNLGAREATWTLTETDLLCRLHGISSDESGATT